jgi:hypothetical protein
LYESLQPAEVSEIVIMAAIKVNFGQTVNFWSILLPLNNFFVELATQLTNGICLPLSFPNMFLIEATL